MENFNLWLETFLKEKKVPNKNFEIKYAGATHYINSEVVMDIIRKSPSWEQSKIKDIIVKIDFHNGDVNHFLEHLAAGYIAKNY